MSDINNDNNTVKYEDDFSMRDILTIFQNNQKWMLITVTAFFLASSIFIFFTPNTYKSSALLSIVDDTEAGGSGFQTMATRYGGLASIAGVSLGQDNDSKTDFVIATIRSRNFFEHLVNTLDILPSLLAARSYDAKTKTLILDEDMYDQKKKLWKGEIPGMEIAHEQYFLNHLTLSEDNKTGFILLGFEHISPEFSYEITKIILTEANNLVRLQHMEEAARSLTYLNSALKDTLEIGTKSSITTLIEAQLKIQMLTKVRKNYILRPIDKPYLPERKSAPSRLKFIALSSILGFILSMFFGMYLHYFSVKKS
jgi:LPS O-antigen subunit length determinant protein (WzzB/FepE family)